MRRKNKIRYSTCIECGEEFSTRSGIAVYCSISCGRKASYKSRMLEYEWRLGKLLAMAKNRAATKGVPFDLTREHLVDLWEDNYGCCALTGQEFDLSSWGGKAQVNPRSPSIDRIRPDLGYTEGNVRLITYHMNIALSDFGTEEFESLAKAYFNGGVA